MTTKTKVRVGGGLIACILAPVGGMLAGAAVFGLGGNNAAAEFAAALPGIPLGAALGWQIGTFLTARFPRSVLLLGGLLLGALVGTLPALVVDRMAPPRRPTPEVFALSETDLVVLLLLVVGPPAGAIIGAVLGYRFGSRNT